MRIDLKDEFVDVLLDGIKELNPPQKMAIESGLLNGENLVISSPTASGKTLIAEMAFLKHFQNGGKTIYIVPLKALAVEKYNEFSKKYEKIGMKVAVSVGDFDSSDEWLGAYDLIITTSEKLDSLMRHGATWIKNITLVIADEIHLMDDPARGPTLEIILTKLMEEVNQIIALSATIANADEIAEWLNARVIKSDYRPIPLYRGVFYPNELILENKKKMIKGEGKPEIVLVNDTINMGKQAIVFVSTRRSAEACAEEISKNIQVNDPRLKKLSDDILNALHSPTKQCRRLARILKNGVAFHHAGLVAKQRHLIEENFRNGIIKVIVATPTLAFGLNLPAYRVIIRDVKRYGGFASEYLPVLEVHQMLGRAGRPKYDKEGEAIIISKTKESARELWKRYIKGKPENIYSKLAIEPVLRMHTLALISNGICNSTNKLKEFFSRTFFAYQYGDIAEIENKLNLILEQLEKFGFIKIEGDTFISDEFRPAFELFKDKKLKPTRIGKRVSELYIDPVSAFHVIQNIGYKSELEYLMMINKCIEMWPLLKVRRSEEDEWYQTMESHNIKVPDVWEIDYEQTLNLFKTSYLFFDWMNERSEDFILKKYDVSPGILYSKVKDAEWMFYAAKELAILLKKRNEANKFNEIRMRIKYGVKRELLPLVKVKGIGRIRARMLFKNGIKKPSDVKRNFEKVKKLFGEKIAKNIIYKI